jgi:hypothetical protein
MTDFAIPVGAHLFSPEALKAAAATALTDLPTGHTSAIVGGVDTSGAHVAIVFTSKDDHWQAVTALQHDWTGHTVFGASGRYSW